MCVSHPIFLMVIKRAATIIIMGLTIYIYQTENGENEVYDVLKE